MRDLYRLLGLPGIVMDRFAIERALEQEEVASNLREVGRFVFLDPSRKARYDWALSRAMDLAEVRSSLGLKPDPSLPCRSVVPNPMDPGSSVSPVMVRHFNKVGWSVAALLLVTLTFWVGSRPKHVALEALSGAAPLLPSSGGERNRPLGNGPVVDGEEETAPIPAPDHGWLQVSPGIQPVVQWNIDTDPGQDYLLTLIDAKSRAVVLTMYLRGGEPYRGLVPEGSFELTYITGPRWFGFQSGFGKKAKTIKPALAYRVLAGSENTGLWRLRLNPNHAEGVPDLPKMPSGQEANPVSATPEQSL